MLCRILFCIKTTSKLSPSISGNCRTQPEKARVELDFLITPSRWRAYLMQIELTRQFLWKDCPNSHIVRSKKDSVWTLFYVFSHNVFKWLECKREGIPLSFFHEMLHEKIFENPFGNTGVLYFYLFKWLQFILHVYSNLNL